ncbi:MAG: glycosyltransferase [Planctomycetota bacterium]|jgi:UDP:flavonoid glycosyltransferase YjiC (YdhE family)
MARFLVMTGPYPGHLAPTVPIIRKLIERGHEAAWITGRAYREKVENAGARFHPLPKEIDPGRMEVYDFYPRLKELKGLAQIKYWVKHVFLDASSREIEAIDSVMADFPADVFLGDTVSWGLYFKSEMGGPPCACISLLPGSLPSPDTAPWGLGLLPGKSIVTKTRNRLLNFLMYGVLLRDLTAYANNVRQGLGLEPYDCTLFSAMPRKMDLTMQISTLAFEYSRSNYSDHHHFIGPIIPEADRSYERPIWWSDLNGSESVVLVNQGTLAKDLDDLIVPTIKGLKDEQMLVVAVPVKNGQLQELPENALAEPFVPFGHLLPHVDVMVTNGGYGGTQFALAHGIPLVVAGGTEDKMEVAARVEWAGAGINLRRHRPSPHQVRDAVKEVLVNPVYRENAKRIQADFANHDAPTRAAELLEALARGEL